MAPLGNTMCFVDSEDGEGGGFRELGELVAERFDLETLGSEIEHKNFAAHCLTDDLRFVLSGGGETGDFIDSLFAKVHHLVVDERNDGGDDESEAGADEGEELEDDGFAGAGGEKSDGILAAEDFFDGGELAGAEIWVGENVV